MKKLLIFLSTAFTFLLIAAPTIAQDANKLKGNDCLYRNTVTMDCIMPLFANIIYWLIIFAGTVALFFVIIGGIKLLTSSGIPEKVTSARNTIMWSIIGLVVILLSFMIVNVIGDITGMNCISRIGFTNCGGTANLKPCGDNNGAGTCTYSAQICAYIRYIPESGITKYSCKWPCGVKKQDGTGTRGKYCTNGTCTFISAGGGLYTCKK